MSAVLLEPGESAEPLIPRDEPEAAEPEAVETEAKAEEPKPEPEVEKKPDDAETKYRNVSQALKEERESKRVLRAELDASRAQSQKYEALEQELRQRREEQKAEADKTAYENDPASYLKQQNEETRRQLAEFQNGTQQEREAAQHEYHLSQYIASQKDAFESENPDYSDAFLFLKEREFAEYEVLGVPKEYRQAHFDQQTMNFARRMVQEGRNPAEVAYNIAKARGFTQKAPVPVEQDANTVIERLEKGQKAAATLSKGGRGEESLLKRIDKMSDAEFDKYWKDEMVPQHR